MKVEPIDATHVAINSKSYLLSALIIVFTDAWFRVSLKATGEDIIGQTFFTNVYAEALEADPTAVYATVVADLAAAFGYTSPTSGAKGVAVPNTAGAPSAGYVQAEAVATLTELRALKTSLKNAGFIA